MKAKVVIIGFFWLVPVACWFGVPQADRAFAFGAGCVVALLMSVFFAFQPMLKCGACGAATHYFANYTPTVARLHGNWRRCFVCRSCGNTIDRMTGMPVSGVPDTPVVPAPSRSGVGCAVSGFGCLLVLGALLAGAAVCLVIARDAGNPDRVQEALLWCMAAAAVGVVMFLAGRFLSSR